MPYTVCHLTLEYHYTQDITHGRQVYGGLGVMVQAMTEGVSNIVFVVPWYYSEPPQGASSVPHDQLNDVRIWHTTDSFHTWFFIGHPSFEFNGGVGELYTLCPKTKSSRLSMLNFFSHWNRFASDLLAFQGGIDLLHIHDYHSGLIPFYLHKQYQKSIPFCATLHNADYQGIFEIHSVWQQKRILKAFHMTSSDWNTWCRTGSGLSLFKALCHATRYGGILVTLSNSYASRIMRLFPELYKRSLVVIPNGIDKEAPVPCSFLRTKEQRTHLQRRVGLQEDESATVVIFMGRFNEQKGVQYLPRTFKSLLKEFPHLQLVCGGPLGDEVGVKAYEGLKRLSQRYPQRVSVLPESIQGDLKDAFRFGGDIFLACSRYEPFGLTDIEFSRTGTLVVGFSVGGFGKVEGVYERVSDENLRHRVHGLRRVLRKALILTPTERFNLVVRASSRFFPQKAMQQRYAVVYDDLLSTGLSHPTL